MKRWPNMSGVTQKSLTLTPCEVENHGVFPQGLRSASQPIQRRAGEAYRQFLDNPSHPSLRFKQVHPARPIYSVRVSLAYRALGVRDGNEIIWFWIGSHGDYDRLIA